MEGSPLPTSQTGFDKIKIVKKKKCFKKLHFVNPYINWRVI